MPSLTCLTSKRDLETGTQLVFVPQTANTSCVPVSTPVPQTANTSCVPVSTPVSTPPILAASPFRRPRDGYPPNRARLASRCRSSSPGRAFTRRAPAKGFQLTSCASASFSKLLGTIQFLAPRHWGNPKPKNRGAKSEIRIPISYQWDLETGTQLVFVPQTANTSCVPVSTPFRHPHARVAGFAALRNACFIGIYLVEYAILRRRQIGHHDIGPAQQGKKGGQSPFVRLCAPPLIVES